MTATEEKILSAIHNLPEDYQQHVLAYIMSLAKTAQTDNDLLHTHKTSTPVEFKKNRVFGSSKGKYKLSKDFDAPLDDFSEYM